MPFYGAARVLVLLLLILLLCLLKSGERSMKTESISENESRQNPLRLLLSHRFQRMAVKLT